MIIHDYHLNTTRWSLWSSKNLLQEQHKMMLNNEISRFLAVSWLFGKRGSWLFRDWLLSKWQKSDISNAFPVLLQINFLSTDATKQTIPLQQQQGINFYGYVLFIQQNAFRGLLDNESTQITWPINSKSHSYTAHTNSQVPCISQDTQGKKEGEIRKFWNVHPRAFSHNKPNDTVSSHNFIRTSRLKFAQN